MNKQQQIKEKQIKEMPICVNCVHAYVCEEYNLYRDTLRKRCAYHNDHFLDIEQYKKQVCKETAEKIFNDIFALVNNAKDKSSKIFANSSDYRKGYKNSVNHFNEHILELAKSLGVEIKE